MRPLGSLEEVTPDRLTDILRREGHLGAGHVDSIDVTSSKSTAMSSVAFLDVTYSTGTSDDLPSKLILKFAKQDAVGDPASPLNEASYYRTVAPRTSSPPSHVALSAQVDTETRQFHLLMADVSDTHRLHDWTRLLPSKDQTARLFEALARLHAQWWDHPDLGGEIGHMPEADHQGLDGNRSLETVHRCGELMGELLSPARRAIYERIVKALPEMRDLQGRRRLTEGRNLTVVHGDVHYGNILFPRDPTTHDVLLIDWQDWHVHVGTNDLAKQIILAWYPERRRAVEKSLVEHYHRTLVEAGVCGYSWQDCWSDYRMSALRMMLVPLYTTPGPGEGRCYGMMEQAFLNFVDLGLEDLL